MMSAAGWQYSPEIKHGDLKNFPFSAAASPLCEVNARPVIFSHLHWMMYILNGMVNNWALCKVQGQSSQLILSPLAGAANRSERRRPLISPTSSRCSAREREECKWVHSRKPSPAPSTLKSPPTLLGRDILLPLLKSLWLRDREKHRQQKSRTERREENWEF